MISSCVNKLYNLIHMHLYSNYAPIYVDIDKVCVTHSSGNTLKIISVLT